MLRKVLCLVVTVGLASPAGAQQGVSDPDVRKGIQQVEDGEYDAAILTLDNAARRLAADPKKPKDLSEAYLYLGIAYVGKGHEAAAKAKFREAVAQIRDLSLSPDKYPPRVIDLFEAAKEEAARAQPRAAATPQQQPSQQQVAPEKKGGSRKGLILAGAGVLVAGGAAAAFAAKGGEDSSLRNEFREGILTVAQTAQEIVLGPGGAGNWKAEVTWNNPTALVKMSVKDASGNFVIEARQVNSQEAEAMFPGTAGASYKFVIGLVNNVQGGVTFELSVDFPKP